MRIKDDRDFNKTFGGLAVSKSVTKFQSPNKRGLIIGLLVLAILFFAFFAFWKIYLSGIGPLASRLPQDTPLYAYAVVDRQDSVLDKIQFWKPYCVEHDLCAAFLKADFINWDGFSFKENMSYGMLGKVEIAKLKSGEAVFAAEVGNPQFWKDKIASENPPKDASGMLGELSGNSDKNFAWKLDDNILYIASSAGAMEEIFSPENNPLSGPLRDVPSNAVAAARVNNSSSLKEENLYANLLSKSMEFPFVLYAWQEEGKILFRSNGYKQEEKQKLDKKLGEINLFHNFFGAGASVFFNNIEELRDFARQNHSVGEMFELWKGFFGMGKELEDLEDSNSQIAVFFSENKEKEAGYDWLVAVENDYLDAVKQLGIGLFARNHPLRVSKILSDGSEMIEMRMSLEGLEWSLYSRGGQEGEFSILRAQGETEGYFAGNLDSGIAILTNSEQFLNRAKNFTPENGQNISQIALKACGTGFHHTQKARLSKNFLRGILLGAGIGDIFLFADDKNNVCGYIE